MWCGLISAIFCISSYSANHCNGMLETWLRSVVMENCERSEVIVFAELLWLRGTSDGLGTSTEELHHVKIWKLRCGWWVMCCSCISNYWMVIHMVILSVTELSEGDNTTTSVLPLRWLPWYCQRVSVEPEGDHIPGRNRTGQACIRRRVWAAQRNLFCVLNVFVLIALLCCTFSQTRGWKTKRVSHVYKGWMQKTRNKRLAAPHSLPASWERFSTCTQEECVQRTMVVPFGDVSIHEW